MALSRALAPFGVSEVGCRVARPSDRLLGRFEVGVVVREATVAGVVAPVLATW